MFNIKILVGSIFLSSFLMLSMAGFSPMMAENLNQEKKPILVDINIIPGEDQTIATDGEDKTLRVELVGSKDFDVNKIDHHSVRLEGAKSNGNLVIIDRNNDGFDDFIVEFSKERLKLKEGTNELTFSGITVDGNSFEGTETFTVPTAK